MEGHGANPAEDRAPLRTEWGCQGDLPTRDLPGERGSWGKAGAEPLGSSRPGLGVDNVPESSKFSRLFAREEEAKPWAWLEKLPPQWSEDDGVAAVIQIILKSFPYGLSSFLLQ